MTGLTTPLGPTGSIPPLDGPILSGLQSPCDLLPPLFARVEPPSQSRRPKWDAPPVRHAADDLRNFRAVSLADDELQIMVDYAYTGDYGMRDIFVHGVALQTDDWNSRVPGTSFPEATLHVGDGTVTINIKRILETGTATSTRVRVCMVSIKHRSAVICKTFQFTKSWGDPGSVPAGPAEEEAPAPI